MQLTNQKERADKAYEAAVAIAAAMHAGANAAGISPSSEGINDAATLAAWDLMTRFYGE